MPRILILIILLWILYFVVKRLLSSKGRDHIQDAHSSEDAVKIVACSQCGLHVPENESKVVDDLIVCNNPSCDLASKKND